MVRVGTHRARAFEWNIGLAKTGKEQVAIRFQVTAGPDEGQYSTWYGYFNTPENAKRTMESIRFCGWEGDDVTDLTGVDANDVEIVVEHEQHEGKTRAKVRWVNEIGGGPVLSKPMNDVQRQAFAARMKGLAVATRPTAPKQSKDPGYPEEWDKQ